MIVLPLIITLVDAQDHRPVDAVGRLGRGSDDHFLRAGLEVYRGLLAVAKGAGGFNHDAGTQVPPGNLTRIVLGEGLDLVAAYDKTALLDLHLTGEPSVVRVIFQQIGQGLVVGQIVHRHNFQIVRIAFPDGPEHLPPNPPKTINPHLDLHDRTSFSISRCMVRYLTMMTP